MPIEYGFTVDTDYGSVRYEPGATSEDMTQVAGVSPRPTAPALAPWGVGYSNLTLGGSAGMSDLQLYNAGRISWFEYQFRNLTGLTGVGDAAAVVGGVAAAVSLYRLTRR